MTVSDYTQHCILHVPMSVCSILCSTNAHNTAYCILTCVPWMLALHIRRLTGSGYTHMHTHMHTHAHTQWYYSGICTTEQCVHTASHVYVLTEKMLFWTSGLITWPASLLPLMIKPQATYKLVILAKTFHYCMEYMYIL